uniref:FANCI_S1 domain-containing protein n=1 Tax=Glossina austeni TaxID=7395 RepID=A0A1A9UZ33_GLOAU
MKKKKREEKKNSVALTPLATLLNKFCGYVQSLASRALPALPYQLFSIWSTARRIIVAILAFDKYFYRFYYKKLFADMNSNSVDFDSILGFYMPYAKSLNDDNEDDKHSD